jgi:hypothetical protein
LNSRSLNSRSLNSRSLISRSLNSLSLIKPGNHRRVFILNLKHATAVRSLEKELSEYKDNLSKVNTRLSMVEGSLDDAAEMQKKIHELTQQVCFGLCLMCIPCKKFAS